MMAGARHRARALTALAFALALGLVASACSSSDNKAQPQKTAPARFEAGPCVTPTEPIEALKTARCGFLVVPENRAKNNGRTIKLPVATLPAQSANKKPDPIVFLEGGPGDTGIGGADFLVAAGVNRDRDVIVFGQRGTLYTQPNLMCPEVDEFNRKAVGLVYDAESTGTEHVAATKACHDRLIKEGRDLTAYNSTQNSADVADLRTALGIPEWNLYGFSYGTFLAQTVMRDHPQGVRSVMIDSVVPPDSVSLPNFWGQFAEGANNVFRACEAQPNCRDRYPDLAKTLDAQVNALEAKPLTTTAEPAHANAPVQVVLDGGALANWFLAYPAKSSPHALTALAKGDPKEVAEAQAAGTDPEKVGMAWGMTFSTICAEWVPWADNSTIAAKGKEAFPAWPESVLKQPPQIPFTPEDCAVWDVPKAPARMREIPKTNIPTLVFAGTFDMKTSDLWSKHVADTLPNATYVAIPGAGHWSSARSSCANDVLAAFYNDPSKKPDLSCIQALTVPPFE